MPTIDEAAPYICLVMIAATLLFIAAMARNAWWTQKTSLPTPPPPPVRPRSPEPTEETIWEAAKAIHDTGELTFTTFPDHPDDDGKRFGDEGDVGYLRLATPEDVRDLQDAARAAIEVYRKQL